MTRFARAKGSKSSNEKAPEDSTPWEVMKEQIIQSKKVSEEAKQRKEGHIARQCPDNPKGLYPNGGCCKLCGDVTHLKKDCPTAKDKKEESSIKLQTLGGADNIEDISQKEGKNVTEATKKPKKIKF